MPWPKPLDYTGYNIAMIRSADETLHLDCTVTPVDANDSRLLPIPAIDSTSQAAREERLLEQQQVSRELIRNWPTRSRNRWAAYAARHNCFEHELQTLANAPELREYTQVIINESDRLQDLMQRLLSSHRIDAAGAGQCAEISGARAAPDSRRIRRGECAPRL